MPKTLRIVKCFGLIFDFLDKEITPCYLLAQFCIKFQRFSIAASTNGGRHGHPIEA